MLGAVSVSFLVLALMPGPVYLGVALVLGGATIAPALTMESNLVGRLARAALTAVTIGTQSIRRRQRR